MKTPPTQEELRTAWESMRGRPALADWPQAFDQVMGDTRRAQCVAIEAIAARHRKATAPYVAGLQTAMRDARYLPKVWKQQAPTNESRPPIAADFKKAAAGDVDD